MTVDLQYDKVLAGAGERVGPAFGYRPFADSRVVLMEREQGGPNQRTIECDPLEQLHPSNFRYAMYAMLATHSSQA